MNFCCDQNSNPGHYGRQTNVFDVCPSCLVRMSWEASATRTVIRYVTLSTAYVLHRTTCTMPHCTAQHYRPYTTLRHITLHCTVLHSTTTNYKTLHDTITHYTTLHNTTPHCTELHRCVRRNTALPHTIPHRTALHHATPYTAPHRTLHHTVHRNTPCIAPHRTTIHSYTPFYTAVNRTTQHTALYYVTLLRYATRCYATLPYVAPRHATSRYATLHSVQYHITPYPNKPDHFAKAEQICNYYSSTVRHKCGYVLQRRSTNIPDPRTHSPHVRPPHLTLTPAKFRPRNKQWPSCDPVINSITIDCLTQYATGAALNLSLRSRNPAIILATRFVRPQGNRLGCRP